jgi:hypothetical protein
VIVNHVASIYPVEVDAVNGIASGQAVPVTWDDVAQLNAKHAVRQREGGEGGDARAAAQELPRRGRRRAGK